MSTPGQMAIATSQLFVINLNYSELMDYSDEFIWNCNMRHLSMKLNEHAKPIKMKRKLLNEDRKSSKLMFFTLSDNYSNYKNGKLADY